LTGCRSAYCRFCQVYWRPSEREYRLAEIRATILHISRMHYVIYDTRATHSTADAVRIPKDPVRATVCPWPPAGRRKGISGTCADCAPFTGCVLASPDTQDRDRRRLTKPLAASLWPIDFRYSSYQLIATLSRDSPYPGHGEHTRPAREIENRMPSLTAIYKSATPATGQRFYDVSGRLGESTKMKCERFFH